MLFLFLIAVVEGFEPPQHPDLDLQYTFHHVLRVDVHDTPTTITDGPMQPQMHRSWFHRDFQALLDADYLGFPDALKPAYDAKKKLGAGSFGVTYLATRKADNKTVAVKLLLRWGMYLTAKDYAKGPNSMIESSRHECKTIQAIHEADSKDPVAAKHVTSCLHDGISPELEKSEEEMLKATMPLYIVLDFVGTDDVDKWWGKLLAKKLQPREYVSKIKLMATGMLRGMQFMAESKTDRQWTHHDLKPQNMVYNDDEDRVVVIDLGTALSSEEPNKTQACTPFYRPPEVGIMLAGNVGWKPPIWSFDTFSAGLTIMGAGATPSGSTNIFPSVPLLSIALNAPSAAKMSFLKTAVSCAGGGTDWKNCLMEEVNGVASTALSDQVERVLAMPKKSDQRKAALAGLVVCRSYVQSKDDPSTGWFDFAIFPPYEDKVPAYLWTLLDDWMKTGFDEILLNMIHGDPTKRPKPSAVLAAEWFKAEVTDWAGTPVEVTCPDIPESEIGILYRSSFIGKWMAALTFILLVLMVAGYEFDVLTVPAWDLSMRIAGLMTIPVPLIFFLAMDWPYVWAFGMCTIGVIMLATPNLPLSNGQNLLIMGMACLILILRGIFQVMTLFLLLNGPMGDKVLDSVFYAIVNEMILCCMVLVAYLVAIVNLQRSARTPKVTQGVEGTELGPVSVA